MADPTVIGENLRRLRGETSQAELARRSGLHRQHIIKIETGQRRLLHYETLQRLADALDVQVTDLTGAPSERKPPRRAPKRLKETG
jgi:transcriptional regulator with XRE-family HTH domain